MQPRPSGELPPSAGAAPGCRNTLPPSAGAAPRWRACNTMTARSTCLSWRCCACTSCQVSKHLSDPFLQPEPASHCVAADAVRGRLHIGSAGLTACVCVRVRDVGACVLVYSHHRVLLLGMLATRLQTRPHRLGSPAQSQHALAEPLQDVLVRRLLGGMGAVDFSAAAGGRGEGGRGCVQSFRDSRSRGSTQPLPCLIAVLLLSLFFGFASLCRGR